MSTGLAGRRVLLTRPAGQGNALAARLQAAGARVACRPTLAIQPLAAVLPACDWIVFTSPNAVRHGYAPAMRRCHDGNAQGRGVRLAAVGPGTAAAMRAVGLTVDVAPAEGGGADDLLAQPDFAPAPGAEVLVVRGEGGRQRLQDSLRARGVAVREVAVYRRVPLAGPLNLPADWQGARVDVTIVTSRSGLEALLGRVGPDALRWLQAGRLVTVSERVATAARAAGFAAPVVAAGAADAELEAAVIQAIQRDDA